MKISPQKFSIKSENRKLLLEEVMLRRGSGSVDTARSKTLTMGRIVKFVVFRCDRLGLPEGLYSSLE